jgi:hypothetical protein
MAYSQQPASSGRATPSLYAAGAGPERATPSPYAAGAGPERATPSQDRAAPDLTRADPDLLAAVVLHTLVRRAPQALTVRQALTACERDPANDADRRAIEQALASLRADGLASRAGGGFAATRAAVRSDALSF